MKVIVGLGNPGKKYLNNRHNIGFKFLDWFVEVNGLGSFDFEKKYQADIVQTNFEGVKIILAKPMTYMNRSGLSVSGIKNFLKLDSKDFIVIHDEIDLSVGKIKQKFDGSLAGHNGLKNIYEKIGTKEFWRIRIGVDRPQNDKNISDYVLGNFKKSEINKIEENYYFVESLIKDIIISN